MKVVVIGGATGTGKSELAVALAKKINGEIVNADAFQVYEGLKIATAAPSEEMKKEVPHHLYAFVPLTEAYDISKYQKDCREKIKEIISRGKTPILVGGSGLYIRSALYDYDLSVDTSNVDMRPYESKNNLELHGFLKELDPKEAEKIPYQNRRRVLRSIAICLALGSSKSEFLAKQNHESIYPTLYLLLKKDRESLYEAVNKRVEKMFEMGLLEETLPLIEKYGRDAMAFKAIGVKELFPYLDGEKTLEEAKEDIKKDTRNYIKRQDTFFAHQFKCKEIHTLEEAIEAYEQD